MARIPSVAGIFLGCSLFVGCTTDDGDGGSFDPSLGLEWTSQELEFDGVKPSLYDVVWSGKLFVAVGRQGFIVTSPDGVTWTKRASGTSEWLWKVSSSGKMLLATGAGALLTSKDGITWKTGTDGTNGATDHVWTGSKWVVVGFSGSMTSTNGEDWTATDQDAVGLLSLAWTGNLLVGAGPWGLIKTSPDGDTWTTRVSGTDEWLSSMVWTGDQVVAVGTEAATTSPDGVTWSPVTDTVHSLNDVIWTGNRLIAPGYGLVQISGDGQTWSDVPVSGAEEIWGVAASKNKVVGVAAEGKIFTSP